MRHDEHPLPMLELMSDDMVDIAHRLKNASP